MSWPIPFSREEPCRTCGAGMSHQPDHAEWCADIAAMNRQENVEVPA